MAEIEIESLVSPPLETNVYILADSEAKCAAIVDPSFIGKRLIERCAEQDLKIESIVLTHGHIDHTHDAAMLARETGASIVAHKLTAPALDDPVMSGAFLMETEVDPCSADRFLEDGELFKVGEREFRILHTPGHSPGSICLLGEKECLVGDLLFRDGVGRWDFPDGNENELAESVRRLARLCDEEIRILSGHGPETTLKRERNLNPFVIEWLAE